MHMEYGIQPYKTVMLLDPVNWLVDEVYQMRGKGLKSLFDFVKFIIDDMPYE